MATETNITQAQSVFDERQEVEDALFKAKEEREAKKRQKYEEKIASEKNSNKFYGASGNIQGEYSGVANRKTKTEQETAEMAAADKFAEENNKFNETVKMFIDEAQRKYGNDADGYAKFLGAGIETIKHKYMGSVFV